MNCSMEEHRYDDIITMPHPVSTTHPQMSMHDRAAQFSPFAALTGHGAAIEETARLTDRKVELEEHSKEVLDEQMLVLMEHLEEKPNITITYFVPDDKKSGGEYITVTGQIRKLETYEQLILLEDGTKIPFGEIYEIDIADHYLHMWKKGVEC